MQQSNVIFANLLIAFLLFISARGELPIYITLLRGGGDQPSSGSGGGESKDGLGSSILFGLDPYSQLPGGKDGPLDNTGAITGNASFEDAVKKMLNGRGKDLTPDQARQILDLWEG